MLGIGKKEPEDKKKQEMPKEILRSIIIELVDAMQDDGFSRRMMIKGNNISSNDIIITLERAKFVTLLNEAKNYAPNGGPIFINPDMLPEPGKKEPASYIG